MTSDDRRCETRGSEARKYNHTRQLVVLMTTQSALQYSFPFTAALFSMRRDNLGFSILPNDTWACRNGKAGIELPTFWLEDNHSNPWALSLLTVCQISTFSEESMFNVDRSWLKPASTAESFDPGVKAISIHSHCRQQPDVSTCQWSFWPVENGLLSRQ